MIARIWRGQSTIELADAYAWHVTGTVFPSLVSVRGHQGAYLLRRETDGRVEFLAVTLWESIDAVREFAGDDPDAAVVEPEARAVLIEFDDFVRYYDVAYDSVHDR